MSKYTFLLLLGAFCWALSLTACDDESGDNEAVDLLDTQEEDSEDSADLGQDQGQADGEDTETLAEDLADQDAPDTDLIEEVEDLGEDEGADQAEEVEDLSDVDPSSCDGRQACFSNSDCDSAQVCHGGDEENGRCCVEGTPGSGEVGASCASESDCEFGLCLARDDGEMFCSGACSGDLDCPNAMTCSDFFSWCYPKDAGWYPESCLEVELDQCFFNDNCDESMRCEDMGGPENEVLCCTTGERGTKLLGEACSTGMECEFGRCFDGLCSALCDFDDDPCEAAGMLCNTINGYCVGL